MTAPRRICPGTIWFATRRTTRRHHLLRPDLDGTMQAIYLYVTAVIAAELRIDIYALQVLSTHIHEVLLDTLGQLPLFLQERNRLLANAIKCHRGWPEEVFSRAAASCVELYGPGALIKEIAYTHANCVEAGLVNDPTQWPGPRVLPEEIGRKIIRVRRPDVYFDPNNPRWPEFIDVTTSFPSSLCEEFGSEELAREALERACRERVQEARQNARRNGCVPRGRRAIFATPHTARARSYEPFGQLNPTFAAAGNAQQASLAVRERRTFLERYRAALGAFRSGIRNVLFPFGTWLMRRIVSVEIETALAPA